MMFAWVAAYLLLLLMNGLARFHPDEYFLTLFTIFTLFTLDELQGNSSCPEFEEDGVGSVLDFEGEIGGYWNLPRILLDASYQCVFSNSKSNYETTLTWHETAQITAILLLFTFIQSKH